MPKASKEELGLDRSGIDSRETVDISASPYFILTGGEDRCSFLEESGCSISPSAAAQMMTLRARPGILGSLV